jgi:hypothetical protein
VGGPVQEEWFAGAVEEDLLHHGGVQAVGHSVLVAISLEKEGAIKWKF